MNSTAGGYYSGHTWFFNGKDNDAHLATLRYPLLALRQHAVDRAGRQQNGNIITLKGELLRLVDHLNQLVDGDTGQSIQCPVRLIQRTRRSSIRLRRMGMGVRQRFYLSIGGLSCATRARWMGQQQILWGRHGGEPAAQERVDSWSVIWRGSCSRWSILAVSRPRGAWLVLGQSIHPGEGWSQVDDVNRPVLPC